MESRELGSSDDSFTLTCSAYMNSGQASKQASKQGRIFLLFFFNSFFLFCMYRDQESGKPSVRREYVSGNE